MGKLTLSELELIERSLEDAIQDAKKIPSAPVVPHFQMQIFSHCAFGVLFKAYDRHQFSVKFKDKFGFTPMVSDALIYRSNGLSNIQKGVNKLFASRSSGYNKISVREWIKEAEIVLQRVKNAIAKRNLQRPMSDTIRYR